MKVYVVNSTAAGMTIVRCVFSDPAEARRFATQLQRDPGVEFAQVVGFEVDDIFGIGEVETFPGLVFGRPPKSHLQRLDNPIGVAVCHKCDARIENVYYVTKTGCGPMCGKCWDAVTG